jgi:hypothetical protein
MDLGASLSVKLHFRRHLSHSAKIKGDHDPAIASATAPTPIYSGRGRRIETRRGSVVGGSMAAMLSGYRRRLGQ